MCSAYFRPFAAANFTFDAGFFHPSTPLIFTSDKLTSQPLKTQQDVDNQMIKDFN